MGGGVKPMLEGWSEFFLLLGGASGALIGLLFVVSTLSANMRIESEMKSRGTAFYMTPTLFHFTTVLVMSALGTVPEVRGPWIALVLAPWAAVGAVYAALMGLLMRRNRLPDSGHFADVACYGILPALVYLALLPVAWITWREAANAPYAIAIGLVVLLIVAIRNAWDLVSFIAPRTTADR